MCRSESKDRLEELDTTVADLLLLGCLRHLFPGFTLLFDGFAWKQSLQKSMSPESQTTISLD